MDDKKNGILEFKGISKTYPGTLALDNVSISIYAGEVFGLVGMNGAGKSTLLKILSGAIKDYEGEIILQDESISGDPDQIIQKGISTVYQGLDLALDLSVEENIFLGLELTVGGRFKIVNHRRQRDKVKKYMQEFGIEVDPKIRARELNVDLRQLIAIVRAVSQNAKVITLDEPTSSLSHQQIEKLFEVIGMLKNKGVSTIFVSHHLNEVLRITDRIGVLRDGRLVGIVETKTASRDVLADMMVGKRMVEGGRSRRTVGSGGRQRILAVSNLTRTDHFKDISFELRDGEVLGIAGLIGSGKTHLVKSLFGADPHDGGTIRFNQRQVVFRNPHQALVHGIAYLPEDRHNEAVINHFSVGDNITLGNMKKFTNLGVIHKGDRISVGERYIEKYRIKTIGYAQPINDLSGGNQQKTIFSRLMFSDCQLLILNNPTQGVDVMSKSEIHAFILEFVECDGKAVIVVSNELGELVDLCHRVVTLKEGRITNTLIGDDVTEAKIMEYIL